MEQENVERVFTSLDEIAKVVEKAEDLPYLDALSVAMEILFFERAKETYEDIQKKEIEAEIKKFVAAECTTLDLRKGIQLAILNGMKTSTQSNHLITPEAIALLVGYLSEKLLADVEHVRLFNLGSGTGNLLTTVMDALNREQTVYAAEVDPTLIQLGLSSANLQKKEIEFFHQDALRPFLLDPVDLVIGDLPVGYYPDDTIAADYELKNKTGHAFSHYLFIEQALHYTKPGGFVVCMIPDSLFSTEETPRLQEFLHKHAQVLGLLRLPETAFKNKEHMKSIFILQKKAPDQELIKQPLLVQLPSLKDTKAMEDILAQIDAWFTENRSQSQDGE